MAQKLKQEFIKFIEAFEGLSKTSKKAIVSSIKKEEMLDNDRSLPTKISFIVAMIVAKQSQINPEINPVNQKLLERLQTQLGLTNEPTLEPQTSKPLSNPNKSR